METQEQPQSWREARRFRAWQLHQKGWTQQQIAEALGVTQGAISQWISRAREGGIEALKAKPPPGPTPRLSQQQRQQLPDELAKGAQHFGCRGDLWTRARVGAVIKRLFGVRYDESHGGRILKAIGWSRQRPIERAGQRDEQAIAIWREETWEALKKKPKRSSG